MWKRLLRYHVTSSPLVTVRYSSDTTQSYIRRTKKYFNDNPYFIVSLGFVGVVLVFGFIVDSITRKKKVTANLHQCLPPCPCHPIVALYSPLLGNKHVLLTGPAGCGKTTLAYRTSQAFLQQQSLWSRKEPRVFYVDGSNQDTFIRTTRECLLSYGITDDDILPKGELFHQLGVDKQLDLMVGSVKERLMASRSRWLMIVDNINDDTLSLSTSLASSLTDGRLLAVSRDPHLLMTLKQSIPSLHHVSITRPSEEQCLTLLQELSSCPITIDNANVAKQLVDLLKGNVMAISCAAVTMGTLQPKGHNYDDYVQLLGQHDEGAIEMYINGIVKSNTMMRHCLDFVANLHSTCPIPIPVILRHLQHPVYHVSLQQALPSTDNMTNQITEQQLPWYQLTNIKKWWQRLDQMFQSPTVTNDPPQAFYSPLFSYQDNKRTGVKLLYHSSSIHQITQHLYLEHTVPMIEQEALEAARSQSQLSWFSSWRGFDDTEALCDYRRQLPGIASSTELGNSGVMASKEYSGDLSYAHYQQLTEHYHRILHSVTETHNCVADTPSGVDNDLFHLTIQAHMMPHLEYLLTLDQVSPRDKARLLESLALGHMMVRHTHHVALHLYEQALKKWEGLNSNVHPLVAHVTKEIANVYSIMDQPDKSLNLLEKAVDIYKQKQQLLTNKQLLQQAECFSSLAIICGNLGDKKRARKLIEDALALYEKVTIATEGNISNHYKYQIASLMTDLGHVLLHLGQLPLAKKYLDMAYMSHRNLHGDSHSEVARCVNVQSIMYALLGDGEESKRLRQEAALINNKLKIIPLL